MYQTKKFSLNIIECMQAKVNFIKGIQINIVYQRPSAYFNGNNRAYTIVDGSNVSGHNLPKKATPFYTYVLLHISVTDTYLNVLQTGSTCFCVGDCVAHHKEIDWNILYWLIFAMTLQTTVKF